GESCVRSEKDPLMNSLLRIRKLLKIEYESRVMNGNFVMFRRHVEEKVLATNLHSQSCLYE
ncbi:unnamed protein product, partial [Brassica rapa]